MKVLLACFFVAVVFVSFSSAFCERSHPKYMAHKWSNKMTLYCEYGGMIFGNGSSFTDLQRCVHCDCTTGGLTCCGIGYKAEVISVPGCVAVGDVCELVILNPQMTGPCKLF